MRLSIITPVYSDPRVGRALDSILHQRHDLELELVVVDGGSTDSTLEVLEDYRPHIQVLISERDRGIYDAMNKGIARASGDVIGILNADDRYYDSDVLQEVAEAFEGASVDACYGDLVYVDDEDRVVRYWKAGPHRRVSWYLGWRPPHPTFFVRREVYERHGVFRLDMPIAADYELMLRFLLKHGIRVRYVERCMVRMASGGNSNASVGQVAKATLEVRRSWRCNRLAGGYFAPCLRFARNLPQFVRRPRQAT